MEILVVSDTHGRNERLTELEWAYPQVERFLHAGDWGGNPNQYRHWLSVKGNNDYYAVDLPRERIVEIEGHRIYMAHGHQIPFSNRIQSFVNLAKANQCDIVITGHTHRPLIEEKDGILILNPGSLSRNRDGSSPSYALLNLEGPNKSARIKRYPPNSKN
ncbi:MAG: metallophosphoesterase [Allobaculum sp.]|nr:metallophosphoesterase [Allobaculum sp.]